MARDRGPFFSGGRFRPGASCRRPRTGRPGKRTRHCPRAGTAMHRCHAVPRMRGKSKEHPFPMRAQRRRRQCIRHMTACRSRFHARVPPERARPRPEAPCGGSPENGHMRQTGGERESAFPGAFRERSIALLFRRTADYTWPIRDIFIVKMLRRIRGATECRPRRPRRPHAGRKGFFSPAGPVP